MGCCASTPHDGSSSSGDSTCSTTGGGGGVRRVASSRSRSAVSPTNHNAVSNNSISLSGVGPAVAGGVVGGSSRRLPLSAGGGGSSGALSPRMLSELGPNFNEEDESAVMSADVPGMVMDDGELDLQSRSAAPEDDMDGLASTPAAGTVLDPSRGNMLSSSSPARSSPLRCLPSFAVAAGADADDGPCSPDTGTTVETSFQSGLVSSFRGAGQHGMTPSGAGTGGQGTASSAAIRAMSGSAPTTPGSAIWGLNQSGGNMIPLTSATSGATQGGTNSRRSNHSAALGRRGSGSGFARSSTQESPTGGLNNLPLSLSPGTQTVGTAHSSPNYSSTASAQQGAVSSKTRHQIGRPPFSSPLSPSRAKGAGKGGGGGTNSSATPPISPPSAQSHAVSSHGSRGGSPMNPLHSRLAVGGGSVHDDDDDDEVYHEDTQRPPYNRNRKDVFDDGLNPFSSDEETAQQPTVSAASYSTDRHLCKSISTGEEPTSNASAKSATVLSSQVSAVLSSQTNQNQQSSSGRPSSQQQVARDRRATAVLTAATGTSFHLRVTDPHSSDDEGDHRLHRSSASHDDYASGDGSEPGSAHDHGQQQQQPPQKHNSDSFGSSDRPPRAPPAAPTENAGSPSSLYTKPQPDEQVLEQQQNDARMAEISAVGSVSPISTSSPGGTGGNVSGGQVVSTTPTTTTTGTCSSSHLPLSPPAGMSMTSAVGGVAVQPQPTNNPMVMPAFAPSSVSNSSSFFVAQVPPSFGGQHQQQFTAVERRGSNESAGVSVASSSNVDHFISVQQVMMQQNQQQAGFGGVGGTSLSSPQNHLQMMTTSMQRSGFSGHTVSTLAAADQSQSSTSLAVSRTSGELSMNNCPDVGGSTSERGPRDPSTAGGTLGDGQRLESGPLGSAPVAPPTRMLILRALNAGGGGGTARSTGSLSHSDTVVSGTPTQVGTGTTATISGSTSQQGLVHQSPTGQQYPLFVSIHNVGSGQAASVSSQLASGSHRDPSIQVSASSHGLPSPMYPLSGTTHYLVGAPATANSSEVAAGGGGGNGGVQVMPMVQMMGFPPGGGPTPLSGEEVHHVESVGSSGQQQQQQAQVTSHGSIGTAMSDGLGPQPLAPFALIGIESIGGDNVSSASGHRGGEHSTTRAPSHASGEGQDSGHHQQPNLHRQIDSTSTGWSHSEVGAHVGVTIHNSQEMMGALRGRGNDGEEKLRAPNPSPADTAGDGDDSKEKDPLLGRKDSEAVAFLRNQQNMRLAMAQQQQTPSPSTTTPPQPQQQKRRRKRRSDPKTPRTPNSTTTGSSNCSSIATSSVKNSTGTTTLTVSSTGSRGTSKVSSSLSPGHQLAGGFSSRYPTSAGEEGERTKQRRSTLSPSGGGAPPLSPPPAAQSSTSSKNTNRDDISSQNERHVVTPGAGQQVDQGDTPMSTIVDNTSSLTVASSTTTTGQSTSVASKSTPGASSCTAATPGKGGAENRDQQTASSSPVRRPPPPPSSSVMSAPASDSSSPQQPIHQQQFQQQQNIAAGFQFSSQQSNVFSSLTSHPTICSGTPAETTATVTATNREDQISSTHLTVASPATFRTLSTLTAASDRSSANGIGEDVSVSAATTGHGADLSVSAMTPQPSTPQENVEARTRGRVVSTIHDRDDKRTTAPPCSNKVDGQDLHAEGLPPKPPQSTDGTVLQQASSIELPSDRAGNMNTNLQSSVDDSVFDLEVPADDGPQALAPLDLGPPVVPFSDSRKYHITPGQGGGHNDQPAQQSPPVVDSSSPSEAEAEMEAQRVKKQQSEEMIHVSNTFKHEGVVETGAYNDDDDDDDDVGMDDAVQQQQQKREVHSHLDMGLGYVPPQNTDSEDQSSHVAGAAGVEQQTRSPSTQRSMFAMPSPTIFPPTPNTPRILGTSSSSANATPPAGACCGDSGLEGGGRWAGGGGYGSSGSSGGSTTNNRPGAPLAGQNLQDSFLRYFPNGGQGVTVQSSSHLLHSSGGRQPEHSSGQMSSNSNLGGFVQQMTSASSNLSAGAGSVSSTNASSLQQSSVTSFSRAAPGIVLVSTGSGTKPKRPRASVTFMNSAIEFVDDGSRETREGPELPSLTGTHSSTPLLPLSRQQQTEAGGGASSSSPASPVAQSSETPQEETRTDDDDDHDDPGYLQDAPEESDHYDDDDGKQDPAGSSLSSSLASSRRQRLLTDERKKKRAANASNSFSKTTPVSSPSGTPKGSQRQQRTQYKGTPSAGALRGGARTTPLGSPCIARFGASATSRSDDEEDELERRDSDNDNDPICTATRTVEGVLCLSEDAGAGTLSAGGTDLQAVLDSSSPLVTAVQTSLLSSPPILAQHRSFSKEAPPPLDLAGIAGEEHSDIRVTDDDDDDDVLAGDTHMLTPITGPHSTTQAASSGSGHSSSCRSVPTMSEGMLPPKSPRYNLPSSFGGGAVGGGEQQNSQTTPDSFASSGSVQRQRGPHPPPRSPGGSNSSSSTTGGTGARLQSPRNSFRASMVDSPVGQQPSGIAAEASSPSTPTPAPLHTPPRPPVTATNWSGHSIGGSSAGGGSGVVPPTYLNSPDLKPRDLTIQISGAQIQTSLVTEGSDVSNPVLSSLALAVPTIGSPSGTPSHRRISSGDSPVGGSTPLRVVKVDFHHSAKRRYSDQLAHARYGGGNTRDTQAQGLAGGSGTGKAQYPTQAHGKPEELFSVFATSSLAGMDDDIAVDGGDPIEARGFDQSTSSSGSSSSSSRE